MASNSGDAAYDPVGVVSHPLIVQSSSGQPVTGNEAAFIASLAQPQRNVKALAITSFDTGPDLRPAVDNLHRHVRTSPPVYLSEWTNAAWTLSSETTPAVLFVPPSRLVVEGDQPNVPIARLTIDVTPVLGSLTLAERWALWATAAGAVADWASQDSVALVHDGPRVVAIGGADVDGTTVVFDVGIFSMGTNDFRLAVTSQFTVPELAALVAEELETQASGGWGSVTIQHVARTNEVLLANGHATAELTLPACAVGSALWALGFPVSAGLSVPAGESVAFVPRVSQTFQLPSPVRAPVDPRALVAELNRTCQHIVLLPRPGDVTAVAHTFTLIDSAGKRNVVPVPPGTYTPPGLAAYLTSALAGTTSVSDVVTVSFQADGTFAITSENADTADYPSEYIALPISVDFTDDEAANLANAMGFRAEVVGPATQLLGRVQHVSGRLLRDTTSATDIDGTATLTPYDNLAHNFQGVSWSWNAATRRLQARAVSDVWQAMDGDTVGQVVVAPGAVVTPNADPNERYAAELEGRFCASVDVGVGIAHPFQEGDVLTLQAEATGEVRVAMVMDPAAAGGDRDRFSADPSLVRLRLFQAFAEPIATTPLLVRRHAAPQVYVHGANFPLASDLSPAQAGERTMDLTCRAAGVSTGAEFGAASALLGLGATGTACVMPGGQWSAPAIASMTPSRSVLFRVRAMYRGAYIDDRQNGEWDLASAGLRTPLSAADDPTGDASADLRRTAWSQAMATVILRADGSLVLVGSSAGAAFARPWTIDAVEVEVVNGEDFSPVAWQGQEHTLSVQLGQLSMLQPISGTAPSAPTAPVHQHVDIGLPATVPPRGGGAVVAVATAGGTLRASNVPRLWT